MENLEIIDDILKQLPKALYSGGLYMNYDLNGFWYCGYDKSVHHATDRDLKVALYNLLVKLKENGYYETLDSKR